MRAGPREAIISLTNRCDARCRMCNIWQLEREETLRAEDYRKLPRGLANVNITGGEPLLRPDIQEVVEAIYEACGSPRIILATNGFRPDITVRQIAELQQKVARLGVAISLDGIGERHDHMRGVGKAFERACATLRGLRALGLKDLRIGFTATGENIEHLPAVRQLADDLGVQFAATVAHNSPIYYATDSVSTPARSEVRRHFGQLVENNLRSRSPKRWLRAYFENGVMDFVEHGTRRSPCTAADDFFYLSPRGEVFPCLILPRPMGNLREQSFNEIWNGSTALQLREEVRNCHACWMVCSARSAMRREPFKILSWVLRRKLRLENRQATEQL